MTLLGFLRLAPTAEFITAEVAADDSSVAVGGVAAEVDMLAYL